MDTDFISDPDGRSTHLKSGAVPTVFEWTTSIMENGREEMVDLASPFSDEAGFTVHVSRKDATMEDISSEEATVASNALATGLGTESAIDLRSTARNNAFIELQSPPRLSLNANGTPSINHHIPTTAVESNSPPLPPVMEVPVPLLQETTMDCPNCDALEAELSRASVELTNLQREKMLLHAKCAELEDEVQKIHVYCKQLKALNGKWKLYKTILCLITRTTVMSLSASKNTCCKMHPLCVNHGVPF